MICPSCHAIYEKGKRFCGKCGTQLVEEKASPAEPTSGTGIVARRREFDARLAADPNNPAILAEYGEYLLSVNLANDAISYLLKALPQNKDDLTLRRKIAAAYRVKKDWPGAAAQLKEVLRINPKDTTARLELAEVYDVEGNFADAARELEGLVSLMPDPVPILERQRDLYAHLNEKNELVRVCRCLLDVRPGDAPTLKLLAKTLLERGEHAEATALFERLLANDARDPLANLMVGIERYEHVVKGHLGDWSEAMLLLERAVSSIDAFAPTEKSEARLYWASAVLHSGGRDANLSNHLRNVASEALSRDQANLLAWCLTRTGDLEVEAKNLDNAIALYERALSILRDTETVAKLSTLYLQKADLLAAGGNAAQAAGAYRKAAELLPDDSTIAGKLRETSDLVRRKRRRLIAVASALAALIVMATAFFYFGSGSFEIRVSPNADSIALYHHGAEIIKPRPGDKLETQTLKFGRYGIKVNKDGYEPVNTNIWGPFGRTRKSVSVTLEPLHGSIAADSNPAGATVTVKNKYETKSGTTPCKMEDVFALPAQIEIVVSGCAPVTCQKDVPADGVLDLGKVSFTGSLKVDSNPTGAEVRINNEVKGVTPLQVDSLLAKETPVEVRMENAGIFVTTCRIEPDKVLDLGAVTLSNLGALQVDSAPRGAKISLDGKEIGVTPLNRNDVEVGNRTVRVDSQGAAPFEKTITVTSGQVTNLGVIAFVGGLKVDSDPAGAEVYIDGEKKGVAPLTLENIPARDIQLELRVPGRGCLIQTLRIKPTEVVDLGVLKVRGFAGEWLGTIGASKDPFRLYLKESENGRLSGAGQMKSWEYWELFDGKVTGMEARFTGNEAVGCSKYTGQTRYYNLTFAMKMNPDGNTLAGKVSGGNSEEDVTLQRTEAPGYSCLRNPEMQYLVQVGNSDGIGSVYCNGNLIAVAPEGHKTNEIDLTPWMQEGLNRIRYTNPHSNRKWTSTFILKEGGAGGPAVLVNAEDSGSDAGTYRRHVVLPYFEKATDLQAWKDKYGTESYLEETIIDSAKVSASSQFGADNPPQNAHDHKLNTGWASAAESTTGEWLKIDFDTNVIVGGCRLFSRMGENGERYARIKRATIECGGKTFRWNLHDTDLEQFLELERMPVSSVRLRVDEVYPGKLINAVAVAEFQAVMFATPGDKRPPASSPVSTPPSTPAESQSSPQFQNETPVSNPTQTGLPELSVPGAAEEPGPTIDTAAPTFSWSDASGAETYGLYISRQPYGESNVVYRNKSILGTQTSFTLPASNALPDGVYRWNLEVFRGGQSAGYASPKYFGIHRSGNEDGDSDWTKRFKGSIDGNLAVHLRLAKKGNALTGMYSYDKFKTDIPLSGIINTGGQIEITESVGEKPVGYFKGTIAGGRIKGTWSKADGSKTLPFQLDPDTADASAAREPSETESAAKKPEARVSTGNESESSVTTKESGAAQNRQDLYAYFDALKGFKEQEDQLQEAIRSLAGKTDAQITQIIDAQIIPRCGDLCKTAKEISTANPELARIHTILINALQERLDGWTQILAATKRGKLAETNAAAERLKRSNAEKQYADAINEFKVKNGLQ